MIEDKVWRYIVDTARVYTSYAEASKNTRCRGCGLLACITSQISVYTHENCPSIYVLDCACGKINFFRIECRETYPTIDGRGYERAISAWKRA